METLKEKVYYLAANEHKTDQEIAELSNSTQSVEQTLQEWAKEFGFTTEEGAADLEAFSDTLQAYLRATVQSSIAAQINAKGGADALAAASACTASRIFFCDDLHENLLYLYTYENAAPAMISFLVGEDGAVSATGLFILYDGFPTGSAAEIQQFLSSLNVEVTEVSVPA